MNSLVHRDYAFSGSILINIYDDRIEFISLGGLDPGIDPDDLMLGISQHRDEKLAAIFYRLKLIEAYGTGFPKILGSYKNATVKPKLAVSSNAFAVTLPNLNLPTAVEPEQQIILEQLKQKGNVTRKDVERLLGVGQTAAGRILKDLVAQKLIKPVGAGRNRKYLLP